MNCNVFYLLHHLNGHTHVNMIITTPRVHNIYIYYELLSAPTIKIDKYNVITISSNGIFCLDLGLLFANTTGIKIVNELL